MFAAGGNPQVHRTSRASFLRRRVVSAFAAGTNVAGQAEALLFIRAKSVRVEDLFRALATDPRVRHAAITTGAYDLVVLAEDFSRAAIEGWAKSLKSLSGVEGVDVQAVHERWTNPQAEEKPVEAWSVIETRSREITFKDLKRLGGVHEIFAAGETNVLARFSANTLDEVRETLLERVGRAEGVERTSTLLSTKRRRVPPERS